MGGASTEQRRAFACKISKKWAKGMLRATNTRLHVRGLEHVPTQGPVVFMANHQGNLDIPTILSCIPLPVGFLAKESLGKVPIMGAYMKHMGCVLIKRESLRAAAQAAIETMDILKSGHSMAIFPEGTRSKGGPIATFKAGSMKIPSKVGVAIIPLTIDGTWKIMEANRGNIRPAVVHVTFHKAISTKGLSNEDADLLPEQVQSVIQSGFVDFAAMTTYETAPKVPKLLRNRLLLGSRWPVFATFFQSILKYRPLAVKGLYDDTVWAASSQDLLHKLEGCGAKFSVQGLEHLDKLSGPAVIVANHMSTLETLMLPGLINPRKPCTFVVKESLANGLIWGPIMRSRKPILVSRKDPRADLDAVFEQGCKALAEGRSVVIFPEGTRRSNFKREDFNTLGIKLAARASVPILPVALKTDFWGNSPILKGFGPVRRSRIVHFEFGEAMAIEGRGKAQHEQILDFIEGRLNAWKAEEGR